jgi:hypothetical protein
MDVAFFGQTAYVLVTLVGPDSVQISSRAQTGWDRAELARLSLLECLPRRDAASRATACGPILQRSQSFPEWNWMSQFGRLQHYAEEMVISGVGKR